MQKDIRSIFEVLIMKKKTGKDICKILKDIRQQIADANAISYLPCECHHKGDCTGTCPVCEEEIRYLEHQLNVRKNKGFSTKVAGVAAGICATVIPMMATAQKVTSDGIPNGRVITTKKDTVKTKSYPSDCKDSVLICGKIVDKADKTPLAGASVLIDGTHSGAATNMEGLFSLKTPPDASLIISFVGYKKKKVLARTLLHSQNNIIALEEDQDILGIVVVGAAGESSCDDVYGRNTCKPKSHKENK